MSCDPETILDERIFEAVNLMLYKSFDPITYDGIEVVLDLDKLTDFCYPRHYNNYENNFDFWAGEKLSTSDLLIQIFDLFNSYEKIFRLYILTDYCFDEEFTEFLVKFTQLELLTIKSFKFSAIDISKLPTSLYTLDLRCHHTTIKNLEQINRMQNLQSLSLDASVLRFSDLKPEDVPVLNIPFLKFLVLVAALTRADIPLINKFCQRIKQCNQTCILFVDS